MPKIKTLLTEFHAPLDLFRTNHNIDPLVNGIYVWMVRNTAIVYFHPEIRKIKKGRN
jgi:hypothetical protein